ncbi:MAG: hypothetical protein ACJAWL_000540 [Motiliproteus sp.]|jgi:hypothetical protein
MPLLSGTDNGPSSTLRAFFSLYFIGLERESGAILMVQLPFQAFQKATILLTKLSMQHRGRRPTGTWEVPLLQEPSAACLLAIFWLAPAAGRYT